MLNKVNHIVIHVSSGEKRNQDHNWEAQWFLAQNQQIKDNLGEEKKKNICAYFREFIFS